MSEQCFIFGACSRHSRFRIITEGPIGSKEISNMIRHLELQREFVIEDEEIDRRSECYWGA